MSQTITNLWKSNPSLLEEKTLAQILAFTGNGELKDGNEASSQFRELITILPTEKVVNFVNQCLFDSADPSGRALQDLINEIGFRLGFSIEYGLYQGKKNAIGHDGLWKSDNDSIVIEAKTTDKFRINLDDIAEYRSKLSEQGRIKLENSSILLVVGRTDTGELEAQIRGSKHAWDIRLISVESLIKLLKLKEDLLDDENTFKHICQILKPLEFTRLDYLIDTIFITGKDARDIDENIYIEEDDLQTDITDENNEEKAKVTPVNFNDTCILHIQDYLGIKLKKQTRTLYSDKEKDVAVTCSVSKKHLSTKNAVYWFAFHPHQKESLSKYKNAYVCFGCEYGSIIFIFKYADFIAYTDKMWITNKDGRMYWHVKIEKQNDKYIMLRSNKEHIDITDKILKLD